MCQKMKKEIEENDPDTLQMLDELDVVWVRLWTKQNNLMRNKK
jgi:hypothetical protein